MQDFVNKLWYPKADTHLGFKVVKWLLSPLSLLFWLITYIRSVLFTCGLKKVVSLPVPVIIVGNITVGGSGKTPTVIYLIELLRRQGFKPGVVSRGYGVKFEGVKRVEPLMGADLVGDEPAMIVARTQVPMVIGSDRVSAAQALIQAYDVDIIISDDGLQHYRLARDIELLILDGERRFGNELLLPAGPLRESTDRQQHVDFIIVNGEAHDGEFPMILEPTRFVPVSASSQQVFDPYKPAVAIAGIANPERFFTTLRDANVPLIKTKAFEDHQIFSLKALMEVTKMAPLLMTEKDAVKCRDFAKENWWYLAVDAKLTDNFDQLLMNKIHQVMAVKQGN
ncbi:tetraacyldisaccharide 4'-kinase [Shewanella sp. VB17]|uniref:tetraacyldisaccharide 4'-kinase n=1 Tax=Shewanella sp. VB17 TaxID=2739432 RepID=UPI0015670573|nr:tetraacyldisaccharide 4'-kinase [Shewanella sp. VB17]NRD73547.1 tetraacyldisaccharide 4'-kinase [Shewanella sp. VB17]